MYETIIIAILFVGWLRWEMFHEPFTETERAFKWALTDLIVFLGVAGWALEHYFSGSNITLVVIVLLLTITWTA